MSKMVTEDGLRRALAKIRVVHAWVKSAGLDSSAYGTHSMRRTKATQIYRKTGNPSTSRAAAGSTLKSPWLLAPADQVAEREPNQAGGQHSGEGFLRGILADVLS
jgi:hypothetical protein